MTDERATWADPFRTGLLRSSGVFPFVGTVLCVFLAPIQSYAFSENGKGVPGWIGSLTGLHTWAQEFSDRWGGGDVYHTFGRPFVLVYVCALIGVIGFRLVVAPGVSGWRVLTWSLAIGAVCDVGAYWGSTFSGPSGVLASFEFYTLVAIIAGAMRYGWVLRRSGVVPSWVGWVVFASGPFPFVTTAITAYWPHGPMLSISIAMSVLGAFTLRTGVALAPLGATD